MALNDKTKFIAYGNPSKFLIDLEELKEYIESGGETPTPIVIEPLESDAELEDVIVKVNEIITALAG